MRGTPLALAFALSLATSAGAARADDAARAAESFKQARAAYERGDFTTAAVGFEQAAVYKAHHGALLNAAAAWEEAGDLPRALTDCDRVLELAGDAAAARAQASQCVARLEPKVATLAVKGPGSFRVRIDSAEPSTLPLRRRLPPGRHALVPLRDDGTSQRPIELDLAAGATKEVLVEDDRPVTKPPPVTSERPSPKRRVPTASLVAWGAGAAAFATAAVLGVRAVDAQDRYEATPTRDAQKDFYLSRDGCNVALGIGGVAVAVGVVLFFVAPKETAAALRRDLLRAAAVGW